MVTFSYKDIKLECLPIHFLGIAENYILDIYHSKHLRIGDIVLDIGAGIGDFTVLASRRIGPSGKVIAIEPNPDDYRLLQDNIKTNRCNNVIAIKKGISDHKGEEEITFAGRTFSFQVDRLENVLKENDIEDDVNFVKMDIEGFESEVLLSSVDILRHSQAIAIELHQTKEMVDNILLREGFAFRQITKLDIYKSILQCMIFHPFVLYHAYSQIKKLNTKILSSAMGGFEISGGNGLIVGTYVNSGSSYS